MKEAFTFKRIVFGAIAVMVLAGLLHQQIITTIVFSLAERNAARNPSVHVAPQGPVLAYHAASSTELVFDEFQTLRFPVVFPAHSDQHRFAHALTINATDSNARFVVQTDINYIAAFQDDEDRSAEEIAITCATLGASSKSNICSSNYAFLSAFLATTPKTAHLFSTRKTKIATTALLTLKTTVLQDTVHAITPITSNDGLRGYYLRATQSDIVYLFDPQDNFYTMLLYHFSEAQKETLLSNLTVVAATADDESL